MKYNKLSALVLLLIMTVSVFNISIFAESKALAFPGAEGGGMYSLGARASSNIEVYHVTNLNDSGLGSFRDAVSQSNRIVVFDVAGNIMLKSILKCSASNITILGQTSPGEGICIGGESVQFIGCSNVIIRYLRFRSGDTAISQEDGVGFRNCTDVIIDHCSISWSVDECLSAYENKNFTAQYCIISESLNQSIHDKGSHGYGGIWGGINASFHHNLISTHNSRNPRIGTSYTVHTYNNSPDYESLIDIRNNVFYNWGANSGYGGENNTRVNFVNNYYKPTDISKNIRIYQLYPGNNNEGSTLFVSGNVMEGNEDITNDNMLGVSKGYSNMTFTECENISDGYTDSKGNLWANNQYINDYPVTTTDAQTAYNDVLNNAGANIYRDSIDKRVVNNVTNGTYPTGSKSGAGLIDSQNDVGGWIALYGEKITDSDNDGIGDEWERANGLDPNVFDSTSIANNGYTNIENYANYLAEHTFEGYGIDSSSLIAAINNAKALEPLDYSVSDRELLQLAIDEAEAVLYSQTPTQEEIDNAALELNSFISSLVIDRTDMLKSAIDKAKAMDLSNYTAESISVLNEAVSKAEQDLQNGAADNYKQDAENIETAISNLKTGKKSELKDIIDFINALDLSMLKDEDIASIEAVISEANSVYDNIEASSAQVLNAIEAVYDIVHKGNYGRKNEGILIECQNFENDILPTDYYMDGAEANIEIVEGAGSNSTKALKGTVEGFYSAYYTKRLNNSYDHYMISADLLYSGVSDICSIFAGSSNQWQINKGNSKTYLKTNDGSYNIEGIYNNFINSEDWTNFAIEVNNNENYVIYYVNNVPIYRYDNAENKKVDCYGVAFAGNNGIAYYDNIKLIDLSKTEYLVGDADANGYINANDVAQLLQKVLNNSRNLPIENRLGNDAVKYIDLDCNGKINSADVAMLLQKALDSSYLTPAEGATIITETTEETTEATTEKTTEATTLATIEYPVDGGSLLFDSVNGAITGYTGNPVSAIIPEEINGVTVSKINKYLFEYCETIKYVSIPSTVAEIDSIFYRNYALERVELPDGITKLPDAMVSGLYNLKSLRLPDTVKTIPRYLCSSCSSLTEVNIPKEVETIEMSAFKNCEALTDVVLPEGLKYIDDEVFKNCTGLKEITLPKSIEYMGNDVLPDGIFVKCYKDTEGENYAKLYGLEYEIIN